jgi:hypothetical protein
MIKQFWYQILIPNSFTFFFAMSPCDGSQCEMYIRVWDLEFSGGAQLNLVELRVYVKADTALFNGHMAHSIWNWMDFISTEGICKGSGQFGSLQFANKTLQAYEVPHHTALMLVHVSTFPLSLWLTLIHLLFVLIVPMRLIICLHYAPLLHNH